MKRLVFTLIIVLTGSVIYSQELTEKSKNEIKAEKKAEQIKTVKQLLEEKSFVFDAMQTKDKNLIGDVQYYTVIINNNQITSFLPISNPAFENEFEIQNSPLNFNEPVISYDLKKEDECYKLKVETRNNDIIYYYYFRILELGHTALKVSSTNHQCSYFKGVIRKTEDFQASK